jgi:FkbM family methyltransferase
MKLSNKIYFYLSYCFHKFILIWIEVKEPKFNFFLVEFLYSLGKIIKPINQVYLNIPIEKLSTVFGTFSIRPNTMDAISTSPAFERRDIDYLLEILTQKRKENKRILFLDVGADVGTYAIAVGNFMNKYKNYKIVCFEPEETSAALLKKNITQNNLNRKISVKELALGDKNGSASLQYNFVNPGATSIKDFKRDNLKKIKVAKLDSLDLAYGKSNVLIMKIDVEGYESQVIAGAIKTLRSFDEAYLIVEDFINPKIKKYLINNKFKFIEKLTPYNSWWKL